MPIIICPGMHPPELTDAFVRDLQNKIKADYFVLTAETAPYSAIAISQWLGHQSLSKTDPLSFVSFSAGVVGSLGAAISWQLQGGKVHSLIALDGWGMPLVGNFSIYRVSHDYFTHWSSSLLGAGNTGFYADPEIEHLDLWRSPANIYGWQVISPGCKTRTALTDYLAQILSR